MQDDGRSVGLAMTLCQKRKMRGNYEREVAVSGNFEQSDKNNETRRRPSSA
jgi:hypothetical protein